MRSVLALHAGRAGSPATSKGTVRTAIAKTRLAGAPVNAGCRPISPARPALTATYAVNAGHAADPRGRPALTGGPGPSSMPPLM